MRTAQLQVYRATRAMARTEPPLDPPDEVEAPYTPAHEIVSQLGRDFDPLFSQLLLETWVGHLEASSIHVAAARAASPGEVDCIREHYQWKLFNSLFNAAIDVAERMRREGDWKEPNAATDEEVICG